MDYSEAHIDHGVWHGGEVEKGGGKKLDRGYSKLEVMGKLMDSECKARCVEIDCKRQRSMLMKLRGGMAELRSEAGASDVG